MDKIGKYEIAEKIGVGGFGAVYKGFDPFIKRPVAVKTCHAEDEETRQRFFQEAEIAGNLHHRNVTTVYDFGVHENLPYLVQEYLEGEDLDRKIKRGDELPFSRKLHILVQIARGLAYAHRQGVVHRDVKPANVRVLPDGTVKIMDFGIAKLMARESQLTKTGMTVGTAAYLAPEQIRGEAVDPRTDVFAFGVMAYELLSSQRPFAGEEMSAVLFQILNHEPSPLIERWPRCPPAMAELVERCLQKDPATRFENGGGILAALETIRDATGETPEPRMTTVASADDTSAPTIALETPAAGATVASPFDTQAVTDDVATAPVPVQPSAVDVGAPISDGVGDLELAAAPAEDAASTLPLAVPGAARARPGRWRLPLAAALFAAALAVAGWWLWDRFGGASSGTPETELAATSSTEGVPAGAADSVAPPSAGGGGEDVAAPGADLTPPVDGESESGAGDTTAGDESSGDEASGDEASGDDTSGDDASGDDVTVTEPPPPPPPGVLTVAAAWEPSITARVAGQATPRPLVRAHSFSLPPGEHVVIFRIDLPNYSREERERVTLGPGERKTLEAPFPPAGDLQVAAALGRPQGAIRVGDRDYGRSPIALSGLPPGSYTLEINPLGAGGGEPLRADVEVTPGELTRVVFDLDSGATPTVNRVPRPGVAGGP